MPASSTIRFVHSATLDVLLDIVMSKHIHSRLRPQLNNKALFTAVIRGAQTLTNAAFTLTCLTSCRTGNS